MDNPEEVLHSLDEFAKLKPKNIPRELEDYLMYVARTGDPVYQWPVVKCLFREKLLNVITEFYETTPTLDLTPSPNVDPFNYESMKNVLLERLEAFSNAPFTVQRLCELLTTPRKEYNRPDKFMRAIEKNILVVSTREPGGGCRPDSALSEPIPNGVSEPPDASNNQSEEITPQTSNSDSPRESVGVHFVSESVLGEQSNHVEPEESGPSLEARDEAKTSEDGISESLVKDGTESQETTDSCEEVPEADVNCDNAEAVKEMPSSTDSSSEKSAQLENIEDLPEQSTDPAQSTMLSGNSNVTAVDSSEDGGDLNESLSPETTPSTDEEKKTVQDAAATEKDEVVSESEIPDSNDAADIIQSSSEAEPETSESSEESSECTDDSSNAPLDNICAASAASEAPSSFLEQEQHVNSTALDADVKDATATVPVPETVDSVSDTQISSELVTEPEPKPTPVQDKVDAVDSSEAAPALEKTEVDAKKKVDELKADVDARISSTETETEEDMEVDEGGNQQPSEADAMEVAEDDEPMEVCEDSTLEEMTTSPQEPAQ